MLFSSTLKGQSIGTQKPKQVPKKKTLPYPSPQKKKKSTKGGHCAGNGKSVLSELQIFFSSELGQNPRLHKPSSGNINPDHPKLPVHYHYLSACRVSYLKTQESRRNPVTPPSHVNQDSIKLCQTPSKLHPTIQKTTAIPVLPDTKLDFNPSSFLRGADC